MKNTERRKDKRITPDAGRCCCGGLVGLRLTRKELSVLQRLVESCIHNGSETKEFRTIHKKLHSENYLRQMAEPNTKV